MANKTVTVLLKAITGAYRAEMTKAAGATQAVGAAAGTTGGRLTNLANVMGPTGKAALKVAVGFGIVGGIAGGFVQSVKAAIEFEDQFARVRKTVDASEAELVALAGGFRDLSTQIPTSTDELTRVGEAAGQLGIEKDQILEFTRTMVDLGNTTNLSAEEAATALARLANITGMPQSEFRTLGSVLVELGNNFETTEAEIAEMSTRLAGAATEVGLTEAEILAFATALSSVGIKAEAGGSAFSRVFTRIRDSVDLGGQELELFANIAGQTAEDFAKAFENRPADAIAAFLQGFGQLDDAGINTTKVLEALQLSELRVADSVRRTAGAGDLLTDALKKANAESGNANALNEESAKKYETVASKIKVTGGALKNLAIEVGNAGLAEQAGKFAEQTTKEINDVTGALQNLREWWEKISGDGPTAMEVLQGSVRETTEATQLMEAGFGDFHDQVRVGGRTIQEWNRLTAETDRVALLNESSQKGWSETTKRLAGVTTAADEAFMEFSGSIKTSSEQMAEIEKRTEDFQTAVEGFFDPLGKYNELLDEKTEKERKSAEAASEAATGTTAAWEDYMGVVEVSGRDVIKGMQEQIDAFTNWESNLKTIAKRGRGDIAAELAAMGPEGAGLVAAWAGMTEAEFKEAGELWNKQQKQSGEKLQDQLKGDLDKAEGIARRKTRDIVDAINTETETGLKAWERKLDGMPDHMRDTGKRTTERGDKGAKDTADAINKRTKDGVRDHKEKIDSIPPTIRAAMRTAEDRGDTGAKNTADAMNTRIAAGVRRWARTVDGYANSLGKGLNPVLVQVGGNKVPINSTAAQTFIAKLRASGGVDEHRPGALITNKPMVFFGEPETGGEAFIPFAQSKRPRSRRIAAETVRRLGGAVDWFANGHVTPPGADRREHSLERRLEMLSQMLIGGIVEAGRSIQRMGYHVGEHPAFGGVAPVHVPNSYHYRGQAIDVNWTGRNEPSKLDFLKSWILGNVQRNLIRELIWRAPGHRGHLHLAMGGGGGSFIPGGFGDLFQVPDLPQPPESDGTVFGDTAVAAMRHTREQAMGFLERKLMAAFGSVAGSGGGGAVRGIVQAVAQNFGWGSGTQWQALTNLITRESGWRPTAQNPTSTAYGLFQFLNSTWGGTGVRKTSDPRLQTIAGLRYIRSRYGSPAGAWSFWQRNRWYAQGGINDPAMVGAFANGTNFVPHTGMALVHRGERITPASENRPLSSFASDAQSLGGNGLRPGDQLTLIVEGQPLTAVVDRRLRQNARRGDAVARKGAA